MLSTPKSIPFLDRHNYGSYPGSLPPVSCRRKVKENVEYSKEKVELRIGTHTKPWNGWKAEFLPLKHQFGLSQENTITYWPIAVKCLYLKCKKKRSPREHSLEPPKRSSHLRRSPRLWRKQILHFQGIPVGLLNNEAQNLSVALTLIFRCMVWKVFSYFIWSTF